MNLINNSNLKPMLISENKTPFNNINFIFEIKFDGTASAIENKDGFLKAIRELKPAHLQETLIEMTSLPSTLYVGTAIGSYKQEVICNVNI